MPWVTLAEAADLEQIKYETIRVRLHRDSSRYLTKKEPREEGGKPQVYVSVESLSASAQARYKKAHGEGTNAVVEKTNDMEEMPWYVGYDIAEFIEQHSQEYYKAVEYLKQVRKAIDYDGPDKTGWVEEYAGEIGSTSRTLHRHMRFVNEADDWAKRMKSRDGQNYQHYQVLCLCRKPRESNTFPSLEPEVRTLIENVWFDPDFARNQNTIALCYDYVLRRSTEKGWSVPSYITVTRYLNYLMYDKRAANARKLAEMGAREYRNRVMVKASRDTQSIPLMGWVQGDGHTMDCWVAHKSGNGKWIAIRPTLVSWIDMRTRTVMGAVLCRHANSQIIKESILKMVYNYGVPEYLLIDNGKDYTAKEMTGRPRNERGPRIELDSITKGFLGSIGVKDDYRAMPYRAWIKAHIERFHGTLINRFERRIKSYTGTLTASRTDAKIHKDIQKMLDNGELMTLEELSAKLDDWLENEYHVTEHSGLKNEEVKTPAGLVAHLRDIGDWYVCPPPPADFASMLMFKSDRRRVYNTGIKMWNQEYRAQGLCDYIGEHVVVRWNPQDVTKIYVYTMKGRKICEATCAELLQLKTNVPQKALEDHMKMQHRQIKQDRERLAYLRTPHEERLKEAIGNHESDVAGLFIEGEKKPKPGKVVSLPADRQYREERAAQRRQQEEDPTGYDYFIQKGESVLADIRDKAHES